MSDFRERLDALLRSTNAVVDALTPALQSSSAREAAVSASLSVNPAGTPLPGSAAVAHEVAAARATNRALRRRHAALRALARGSSGGEDAVRAAAIAAVMRDSDAQSTVESWRPETDPGGTHNQPPAPQEVLRAKIAAAAATAQRGAEARVFDTASASSSKQWRTAVRVVLDSRPRDADLRRAMAAPATFNQQHGSAGGGGHAEGTPLSKQDSSTQTDESSVVLAAAAARAVTSGQTKKAPERVQAAVAAGRPWEAYHERVHSLSLSDASAVMRVSGRAFAFDAKGREVSALPSLVALSRTGGLTLSMGPAAAVMTPDASLSSATATTTTTVSLDQIQCVDLGYGNPAWSKVLSFYKNQALLRDASSDGSPATPAAAFPGFTSPVDAAMKSRDAAGPLEAADVASGISSLNAADKRWLRHWLLPCDMQTLAALGGRALSISYTLPEDPVAREKGATSLQSSVPLQEARKPAPGSPGVVSATLLLVFDDQQRYDDVVHCVGLWARNPLIRRVGSATLKPGPLGRESLPFSDEIVFRSPEDAHLATVAFGRLSSEELDMCRAERVSPMAVLAIRKRLFTTFALPIVAANDLLAVADVSSRTLQRILDFYARTGHLRLHSLLLSAGPHGAH